ncbi:MAG: flavodoxin family protein [Dehalococcoidia bacterium]|nr:flavodoxin family protein [Dehalococcoidia bacterium]
MPVSILGISGSPVKDGNTEAYLSEALKAAEGLGDVSTELIRLIEKRIGDCRHCNWCLSKQAEGFFCGLKDDMLDVYPKIINADAILLATPTYGGRLSGYSAVFIDRWRALVLGKRYRGVLRNKVGGAMTVAWFRNAGPETALLSIVSTYLMWGMVVATPGEGGCQFGAVGVSSDGGSGRFVREDKLGVLKDQVGMASARALAKRTVELARIMKAGRDAQQTSGQQPPG